MTFKDLKPGMKVWIREDLEVDALYGRCYFVDEMRKLVGLQTIADCYGVRFTVKEDIIQYHFTNEMVDWEKTEQLNKKETKLIYDGTTLEGQIGGQEIKVVRSPEDKEDLEKAVMMGLIKSLGYSYDDVKKLQSIIKKVWRPKHSEKYYYILSSLEVSCGYNENYSMNKRRIQVGNCFETKEEAEKRAIEVRKIFKK